MANPSNLDDIIKRILDDNYTDADRETLRQLLDNGDRKTISQLGKYNVNISTAKDIHIGDRTYYQWNDETIQALMELIRNSQDKNQDTEYFRTIEACNDRQILEKYFEAVLPQLRQQGALEICQNIFKTGRLFNYIAKISDFEPGWGMRGEAFFMFSEFSSMQIKILQQYSGNCLQMAKTNTNSSSVGEAVYNFRIPSSLCFAIAIVDRLDPDTVKAIQTTNPIDNRVDALWYEIPVVCELSQRKIHFYNKAASFFDNFKGEIVWQGFRSIIQENLSFPSV